MQCNTGRPTDGMWCAGAARRPHHAQSRLVPHWSLSFSFLLSLPSSCFLSLPPSRPLLFLSRARARTLSSSLSAEERLTQHARVLSLARARSLSRTHTSSISPSPLSSSRTAEECILRQRQSDCLCAASILQFISHTRSLSLPLCRPSFSLSYALSLVRLLSLPPARVCVCVRVNL